MRSSTRPGCSRLVAMVVAMSKKGSPYRTDTRLADRQKTRGSSRWWLSLSCRGCHCHDNGSSFFSNELQAMEAVDIGVGGDFFVLSFLSTSQGRLRSCEVRVSAARGGRNVRQSPYGA